MNIKKYLFAAALGSLTLATSCRSEDPAPQPTPTPTPTPPTATVDPVNEFVWKAMNSWYYWQANVPTLADSYKNDAAKYAALLNGKTPDKLFYGSLLYEYGKTDRFSWIENNNKIIEASARTAEVESVTGLELSLFPKGGGSANYVALVNYVVPGSSAANAGVKRGDVITKINGTYLTKANYGGLFGDSFTITRAETATSAVVGNAYVVTTTDKNENIPIVKTSIDENPIAFYKVFEMGGKKIGYLVYNGFKIDYNDELNAQFAKMKADGITDLILDLRYNGGGSLTSASGLATMISGNTSSNYVYMEYNSKHTTWNGYDPLSPNIDIYNVVNGHPDKTGTQPINTVALPKVYVLVSYQTASASELTVIALNKIIPVETIGYVTVGKFVGSHTLYDSPNDNWISYEKRNTSHNWKLQPITFKYYNSARDPHPTVTYSDGTVEEGILPKSENRIHPYQWIGNVKEFGVTTDPELKRALELITGQPVSRMAVPFVETTQKVISKEKNTSGLHIDDINDYLRRKRN